MSEAVEWLNKNSPMISALATVVGAVTSIVIVWLTRSLSKFSKDQARWTEESARITNALKEIEKQRDLAAEPRVFVWFSGYNAFNGIGTLVLQNSGGRSLFLQSLSLEPPSNIQIECLQKLPATDEEEVIDSGGKLVDIVITTDRIERFVFKFKGGVYGHQFELLLQLYTGDPVRIAVDPSQLTGYEYRVTDNNILKAFYKGHSLDRNGRVKYEQ